MVQQPCAFLLLVLSLLGVDLDFCQPDCNAGLDVSSVAAMSSKVSYNMYSLDIIIFSVVMMESATQK